MRQMIAQALPQVFSSVITVVAVFAAMLSVSLWLTLFVLVYAVVMMLVAKRLSGQSGKYFVRQQRSMADVNGFIEEMVGGQRVIKVFCHEEKNMEEFARRNGELCLNATEANKFANILMPIMNNMGHALYVLLAVLGAALGLAGVTNVSLTGTNVLTLGMIASFMTLSRSFVMPLSQVSQQLSSIIMALAGAERIFRLMDEPSETDEGYVTLVNAKRDENGQLCESDHRTGLWAWKHPHSDGTTTYTIPGADVTGDIVISSNKQVKQPATFTVIFDGTGAGDASGESSVKENTTYTFTVDKKANFEYTITATMGGKDVTVTEGENNTYTISNVSGDLVITIEKKSTLTMEVAVSEYVQLDDKTVFLVTVTGTPEEGKAFAYGDNVMYKTTAYGENVYSWLVIVDKGEAFTVATAEANITQASATAEEVKQSYDVNETGVVDINDAQLTYDIYSGKYTDFEKVSVRKFLRADVTLDKAVNSTDAVAVVANSK